MSSANVGADVNHGTTTVATTATRILVGRQARESLLVQNLGASDVYVGGSGVTTATGVRVAVGEALSFDEFVGAPYGITATGTADVRYLEVY